jgi:hypothetical protein
VWNQLLMHVRNKDSLGSDCRYLCGRADLDVGRDAVDGMRLGARELLNKSENERSGVLYA